MQENLAIALDSGPPKWEKVRIRRKTRKNKKVALNSEPPKWKKVRIKREKEEIQIALKSQPQPLQDKLEIALDSKPPKWGKQ